MANYNGFKDTNNIFLFQNLNHLLNFKKYEPQRGGGGGNNYYGGGGVRRNPRQGKWQGKLNTPLFFQILRRLLVKILF